MTDSKRNQKLLAKLRKLSILTLIAVITLANSKCDKGDVPAFDWHPHLYATDADTQTVIRGDEEIMCSDLQFNSLICMPMVDVVEAKKAYFAAVNQCKTWKSEYARKKVYEMGHNIDADLQ